MNDEPLNPLPIEPATSKPIRPLDEDGKTALIWTLAIALAPIVCDGILTAVIGGRPFYSVGLFHIGLALFGITLAATVRILSHGRGTVVVPFLFIAAILEVVIALYFGGTFAKSEVDRSSVSTDIHAVSRMLQHPLSPTAPQAGLVQIRTDLRAVRDTHPDPDGADYVVMAILGLFSFAALLRLWSPPTPEERRREGRNEDG